MQILREWIGRRSGGEQRQMIGGKVVTRAEELHRVPVAALVDRGVREHFHHDVGLHGVVLEFAAGSPAGAEAAPLPWPDPDSGLYKRRVLFVLPHDRDSHPDGVYREGAPGEAVDPRTIEPKKPGAKTPRSQHGPAAITTA